MRSSLLTLLLAATLPCATALGDGAPTLADTLAESASLRDVFFVDSERGWAVGDRGLVLHTADGGEHWRRQQTPTTSRLDAVWMLNADHGWAVGGSIRPYTHESRGVVLRTDDGGRNWRPLTGTAVPRLRAVRFFDKTNGVAAGDGTGEHPSGVFTTDDGGAHWRPLPSGSADRWRAGAFAQDRFGELAGVVAGLRGASARIARREVNRSPSIGDRRGGYGVALVDAARGWLVGDGGLVRTTEDGGGLWQAPPSDPPARLAEWFDWRAVAARGQRLWIAGSPGSCVVSSDDGGRSWHVTPTGQATPITAIHFTDDHHGWAVGQRGLVLATRDGGATWRTQRGGDRRAAVAVVVSSPERLPAELIASVATAEGYRTVVAAPLLPGSANAAADGGDRLAVAGALVGADATRLGWSLPVNAADAALPRDRLLERLDRLTDNGALRLLGHELARLLMTHRPDVLVIPQGDSAAELIGAVVPDALQLAAKTPPAGTHLAPWRPRRVVAVGAIEVGEATSSDDPRLAWEQRLSTGDFSTLLGATPSQAARPARGLLADDYEPAPSAFGWRTIAGDAAPATRRADLLAGIGLARGGDARRPAAATPVGRLDQLRRVAMKRRNVERLLGLSASNPAWSGQVVDLTGGLDEDSGSELLRQLADGYRETGRLELAADTLYLLARRYPDAPLADAALVWLVRYYASGERRRADARSAASDARPDALANVPSGAAVLQATTDRTGNLSGEERLERADRLIDFLRDARPALYAEPSIRFTEAAVQRARGYGAAAERTALLLSKRAIADDWRRAAEAERWVAEPKGLPPEKPMAACRYVHRRPMLDGHFEDAAWEKAQPVRLSDAESSDDASATVRFARDEEFLYLAVEAVSVTPPETDGQAPRPRDADLTAHDRLRLRIDVDRDYTTAFELTIDERGWTRDELAGDRHWKPTWYVAAASEPARDDHPGVWRLEAAIPLGELIDPEHAARAAWAVSLERLRPGEPSASWTDATAASDSPDAYGLLLLD